MFDGCHQGHSVEILRDEDDVVRAAELLRIHYAFRVGDKLFSPAQTIKLSKCFTIFTAIMWREGTLTGSTQIQLSYARVLEDGFDMHYADMHIMGAVEKRMSSHFLASNSRET